MKKFNKKCFVLMFCFSSLFQFVFCYGFKINNLFIDIRKNSLIITLLLVLYYYHYFQFKLKNQISFKWFTKNEIFFFLLIFLILFYSFIIILLSIIILYSGNSYEINERIILITHFFLVLILTHIFSLLTIIVTKHFCNANNYKNKFNKL